MCFPSNSSSSSSESKTFFGEVSELAEVTPYDDSFEPLTTKEEAISNNARMNREAQQISQITNTETLLICSKFNWFTGLSCWGPSAVSYSCFFFLLIRVEFCYVHKFVAVSRIVVRNILDLKIINPLIKSSPFWKKSPHNATWKFFE